MKSFPLSCRVARACAVTFPFEVATSLPGLRPPRLDMNGAECLRGGRAGGGRGDAHGEEGHRESAGGRKFTCLRLSGKQCATDAHGGRVGGWVDGWSVPLNAYNTNKQSLPSAVSDGIATSGNVSRQNLVRASCRPEWYTARKCLAGSTATADGMETPESRHRKAPRWG